jgi:hypothetical protein
VAVVLVPDQVAKVSASVVKAVPVAMEVLVG